MNFQVLYVGLQEPKQFKDLLTALEHVALVDMEDSFLLKCCDDAWEDGARTFRSFQTLFAPIGD